MITGRATAVAPANNAFVKYWGLRVVERILPMNGSISLCLDTCLTTTSVAFDTALDQDIVTLTLYDQAPQPATGNARKRVVDHLDRLRALAGTTSRASVMSSNTFPNDAGIASSAAALAALTLAGSAALGLSLDTADLSRLARRSGSGSASRSIPDGYVEWRVGDDQTSIAETIAPPQHWHLCDVVAVVDTQAKKIGSAENHRLAATSPYFDVRMAEIPRRIAAVRQAIARRDLELLGTAIEAEAVSMHVVCMTQTPPSWYWSAGTLAVIHAVQAWRAAGLAAYFTIDAGPNVHVICAASDQAEVRRRLGLLPEVAFTLTNGPGHGARLLAPGSPGALVGQASYI
jgi:diphosphomevalonate decarboxylase